MCEPFRDWRRIEPLDRDERVLWLWGKGDPTETKESMWLGRPVDWPYARLFCEPWRPEAPDAG